MKIEVRFRGLDSSASLREHVVHRIHVHVGRFGRQVSAVRVRIADINGPKGGVDKRCRITVRGPRVGALTLDELSADAYSAVDLAVDRIARAVARSLERARGARQGGPA